ncbi:MAG: GNAT family N-acetyltransferase [Nitriliruptorales bacterium]|nr:GNAT family N-acetyltransferase [Nitriliruptorales bacterium]
MQFRKATESDAEFLAQFGARAFRGAFAADNDPVNVDRYVAKSFSIEQVTAELADPAARHLLAVDTIDGHDVVVGYVHLRAGSTAEGVLARRPVEVVRIYVEPGLTGRGYGAALLRAGIAEAQNEGGDVLWLGVWEHNDGAIRFYLRHGFRRVGRHVFMLGDEAQTDEVFARPLDLYEADQT